MKNRKINKKKESINDEEKRDVVAILDAANIAHHSETKKYCKTKNPFNVGLLEIAMDTIENDHGMTCIPVLKRKTYTWARNNQKDSKVKDFSRLKKLVDEGKVKLFDQDSEDIYFIELAEKVGGFIISNDKFAPEKEKYPNKDWDKIDEMRCGFEFIGTHFICPDLPKNILPFKESVPKISLDDVDGPDDIELLDELEAALYTKTKREKRCHKTELKKEFVRNLYNLTGRFWEVSGWESNLRRDIKIAFGKNMSFGNFVKKNLPSGFMIDTSNPSIIIRLSGSD